MEFILPGSKSIGIPSSALKVYQFIQDPHWELHPEPEERACVTLALPPSRVGAQDTILLLAADRRVPQTCFVCCLVNNPQGHLSSILNINAPSTLEFSLHYLVFSPSFASTLSMPWETPLSCSQLLHSLSWVCQYRTHSVFGHDLINKPECVDFASTDQPTFYHSCTPLEPPLGAGASGITSPSL